MRVIFLYVLEIEFETTTVSPIYSRLTGDPNPHISQPIFGNSFHTPLNLLFASIPCPDETYIKMPTPSQSPESAQLPA